MPLISQDNSQDLEPFGTQASEEKLLLKCKKLLSSLALLAK